jgi:RNA polymerase sigma-70 factor (ECF subfamily)
VTESDAELVRSCLDGQESGLRQLTARYQRMVFGICYRMLGHREDAEDITQETFLRAFRSLHRWDSSRPFRPLLGQRARRPSTTEFVSQFPAKPDAPQHDLAEELQLALETLRENYRSCFILFHHEELGCTEIGEILGCPEGTVKTWLYRARRQLANHLKRRGITPYVEPILLPT